MNNLPTWAKIIWSGLATLIMLIILIGVIGLAIPVFGMLFLTMMAMMFVACIIVIIKALIQEIIRYFHS